MNGSLFSALISDAEDHSVTLEVSHVGQILGCKGNPRSALGYTADDLVGKNISILCPPSVEKRHDVYMRRYKGVAVSKFVGQVRNIDVRHRNGCLMPFSIEVREIASEPHPLFSGRLTEVESDLEAIVSVDPNGKIFSASDSCRTMFGYESEELLGHHFTKIAPSIRWQEGKNVVACQHKDLSTFYVSVEITPFVLDGENLFRGTIRRVVGTRPDRKRSAVTDDYIFSGDLLGWYEITKTLGSGYFGKVKMATHRLTGLNVAVKTLKKAQYQEAGMKYPPREIELINKLNHPNICRLYDTIYTDDAIYMITEVIPGGELFDYVSQKDHLSEVEARKIMRALVSATDYMHRAGIAHRDLKMENILLDGNGDVKVIDLGLGNFFDQSGARLLDTFCGSADYAAPELWRGQKYRGPEVDVWSLGVVLFVITTGFIPFNDSTHVMQIRYHWPKQGMYSSELKDIVAKIFQVSDKRIDMEGLIKHPWLNAGGLPLIERRPLKLPMEAVNSKIVDAMEQLGFSKDDTVRAVLGDYHNQLTTTYYLMEHQLELESQTKGESSSHTKRFRVEENNNTASQNSADNLSTSGKSDPTRASSETKHCIIA